MPTYDAYCRAPLVNPALIPLSDHTIHMGGLPAKLAQKALENLVMEELSPLDQALATKLGEYTEMPALPELEKRAARLPENAGDFLAAARAATMIAAAARDKDGMLRVLAAMRAFTDALPQIPEETLFPIGADALRLGGELYRRTGQKFLLTMLERLRAQLPDVSGMFHSFPYLHAYTPEAAKPEESDEYVQYHRRMTMLGTGNLTADALAITAGLAMYSGSARDASASKVGFTALNRYHGLPNGSFSADVYLAGRDPSRATDLYAVCAQVETLHDLLSASGDLAFADRLELLAENALADVFAEGGVRELQAVNRVQTDPRSAVVQADPDEAGALLRAVYALRRSVWMAQAEDTLCYLLPYESSCLTRMNGVPVRITATVAGLRTVTLHFECKQPVAFTLSLRIPAYAEGAAVSIGNGKAQHVDAGALYPVKRTFQTGDTLTLTLPCEPRVETGYRGSASVYCGPVLMALPLPAENAAYQYALDADTAPALDPKASQQPCVVVDACDAPDWGMRNQVIAPPPQGMRMGAAYELTLLPYAGMAGRIAAFPQAGRRDD